MEETGKAVRIKPRVFTNQPRSNEAKQVSRKTDHAAKDRERLETDLASDTCAKATQLTDLRRTPPPQLVEKIVSLSAFLPKHERDLISSIFIEGKSMASISRISGRSHKHVRDQVRKIVNRMLSPAYAYVALESGRWPPVRRRVATLIFLHGKSLRPTAKQCNQTLYSVRKTYIAINEFIISLKHDHTPRPPTRRWQRSKGSTNARWA